MRYEAVQQSQIGRKRKENRALNPPKSKIFSAKSNCGTASENTEIGDNVLIGTNSVVDGNCKIGSRVSIQTNVYITAYTVIENDVFMGPCAVTTNDKYMEYGAQSSKDQ
jgi:UDP-3-O-[3-hydroxymyristoyl] glucosamine N-acyltransferase